jgi:hypothetical protein
MKKLLTLLVCIFIAGGAFAQEAEKPSHKEKKEARKAAEAAAEKAAYQAALKAIKARDFAIEADRVEFRRGTPEFVNPSTNFVTLRGDIATVQLSSNTARQGVNGMGGLTLDGKASNIKVTMDSKGNTTLSMSVIGRGITGTIKIILSKDSNKCDAEVSGNFTGGEVTLSGKLYPASESSIFKGRSI